MPRRLIEPGPFDFDELNLPHASDTDREVARRMKDKWFPGVELSFELIAVPTFELIESAFVDAVLRKQIPTEVYEEWRRRGAPESEARKLFAEAGAQQRNNPMFAKELPRVQQLEELYAAKGHTDPLIARSLELPLSTGAEALFVIDGRHRLIAAAASDVPELEVYIGKPKSA